MVPSNRFLGRRAELERLRRAADDVQNRHVPRFVLIEGPPWVGKTALLNEAVGYVPDWWRANAYLDVEDRGVPGHGAKQLLRKPQRHVAPDDRDELLSWVQATADAISEPIVVVMEDLQWIDDVSAGIIHQAIRNIEDVPMFNLVTTRTSNRAEIRRFQRLADTAGEALRIRLLPFSGDEVRESLMEMTGLPISLSVAERVHQATGGFPELVRFVGQRLTETDSQASAQMLRAALRELDATEGPALALQRTVTEMLDECSAEVQQMVAALAVAEGPLSVRELEEVVSADSVDVDGLRQSGLVREGFADGRFTVAYDIFARSVAATISSERRAALHLRLAEVEWGTVAVRHRAEAARLNPCTADTAEIIADLVRFAKAASAAGEPAETLRLARSAFVLRPTDTSLEAMCFAALRVGMQADLSDAVDWVQKHEVYGVLRRSLLARESLICGNLETTLLLLRYAEDLREASPKSLIFFAHTVLQTTRTAALHGSYQRIRRLVERTVDSLQALEESCATDHHQSPATVVAAPHEVCGIVRELRISLQAWVNLQHWDYATLEPYAEATDAKLQELREDPGSEQGQMLLLVARSLRMRLAGHGDRAFADLTAAIGCWPATDVRALAYAHLHSSIVFFDAGMWSEAHTHARRGAAEVLNVLEENIGAMAYSLEQLVPAARGHRPGPASSGALMPSLRAGHDISDMARAARGYVQAWIATASGDYERVVSALTATQVEPSVFSRSLVTTVLLGRGFWLTRREAALPALAHQVQTDTVSSGPLRGFAAAYLKALQALAAEDRVLAAAQFDEALRHIAEVPSVQTGEVEGDGGSLRMYRTLLALDLGHCVLSAGEELAGRTDQTKGLLLWAASVFRSCGAEGLFHRADELYRSLSRGGAGERKTNGRPLLLDLPEGLNAEARYALSGLTSREREISLLVGRGLTNRDVAERLVLSVRTVEYHVANVLGKLTLDSRRELRRLLGEPEGAQPST